MGIKVLVVDDEPYILKILSFKLRSSGFVPFEATGSEEALRIVREEHPDLVLLDVSIPHGLSGFDLCRILRENPGTARTPIVMLTARNLPSEVALGIQLGAAAYITKPFSTRKLIEELQKVVSART
jgi:two-component system alkaline phosphatase synthesis response regulator PhoP